MKLLQEVPVLAAADATSSTVVWVGREIHAAGEWLARTGHTPRRTLRRGTKLGRLLRTGVGTRLWVEGRRGSVVPRQNLAPGRAGAPRANEAGRDDERRDTTKQEGLTHGLKVIARGRTRSPSPSNFAHGPVRSSSMTSQKLTPRLKRPTRRAAFGARKTTLRSASSAYSVVENGTSTPMATPTTK